MVRCWFSLLAFNLAGFAGGIEEFVITMDIVPTQNDYRVNLEVFEGPLDLLLYLIKKNDLEVYDIPIAFILEEYIKYLDSLQKEMDIDLAGEFLLMAAELVHVKSKMLLPGTDEPVDEDDGVDPRADLVRRLLEYQRYKEAAEQLANRAMVGRDVFVRRDPECDVPMGDAPIEGNVYDLINAFSNILKRMPAKDVHEIMVDRVSVNDRIMQLADILKEDTIVSLEGILPDPFTRYDIVVTFLALLEMAKLKMIKVYQGGPQDTIRIRGVMKAATEEDMRRLIHVEGVTSDGGAAKLHEVMSDTSEGAEDGNK